VTTGTVLARGVFPNPGNVLRPRQYARVRAVVEVKKGALLVPQRAVQDVQRAHQVTVVM
jgi:membrane fusion protein (multidrug efflux system)